jgi:hypothetical protein
MRILFIRGASPYVKSLSDKSMMDMSPNILVKNLILIAEKQHYFLKFMPEKKKKGYWIKYAIPSFISSTTPDDINS